MRQVPYEFSEARELPASWRRRSRRATRLAPSADRPLDRLRRQGGDGPARTRTSTCCTARVPPSVFTGKVVVLGVSAAAARATASPRPRRRDGMHVRAGDPGEHRRHGAARLPAAQRVERLDVPARRPLRAARAGRAACGCAAGRRCSSRSAAGVLFLVAAQLAFDRRTHRRSSAYPLLALVLSCDRRARRRDSTRRLRVAASRASHAERAAHTRIAASSARIGGGRDPAHPRRLRGTPDALARVEDGRHALRDPRLDGHAADIARRRDRRRTFNVSGTRRPGQWPFSRCYHAKVIDQIAKGHPTRDRGRHPVHRAEPQDSGAPVVNGQCVRRPDLAESGRTRGNVVLSTTEVDRRTAIPTIFGGDAVLKTIGARPGEHAHPERHRRRDAPRAVRDPEPEELRDRRRRGRARDTRSRRRARTTSWIDYRRPARTRSGTTRTRASWTARCRRRRSGTRSS